MNYFGAFAAMALLSLAIVAVLLGGFLWVIDFWDRRR